MFIPLKLIVIGIDPPPYNYHHYPLVSLQKAIEAMAIESSFKFTHWNWWCSIVHHHHHHHHHHHPMHCHYPIDNLSVEQNYVDKYILMVLDHYITLSEGQNIWIKKTFRNITMYIYMYVYTKSHYWIIWEFWRSDSMGNGLFNNSQLWSRAMIEKIIIFKVGYHGLPLKYDIITMIIIE